MLRIYQEELRNSVEHKETCMHAILEHTKTVSWGNQKLYSLSPPKNIGNPAQGQPAQNKKDKIMKNFPRAQLLNTGIEKGTACMHTQQWQHHSVLF